MTQIAVSDELAASLAELAASRDCTTEEFLQDIVSGFETDEAFAERTLTPALQARMLADRDSMERGEYITEEEVDRKFDAFFRELESR